MYVLLKSDLLYNYNLISTYSVHVVNEILAEIL